MSNHHQHHKQQAQSPHEPHDAPVGQMPEETAQPTPFPDPAVPSTHKMELAIEGMTCATCEVLIERKFKKIAGVESVRVNHANGKAVLHCSQVPSLEVLQQAIQDQGYSVHEWDKPRTHLSKPSKTDTRQDWSEIGNVVLILGVLYVVLKKAGEQAGA